MRRPHNGARVFDGDEQRRGGGLYSPLVPSHGHASHCGLSRGQGNGPGMAYGPCCAWHRLGGALVELGLGWAQKTGLYAMHLGPELHAQFY